MTLELSIVVPAFNEANRLTEGMKRFDAAVSEGAVDLERTEMLVVDDGSSDGTAATARSLLTHLPHHAVISLPANQGKGAAVRTGVARARGRFTAYMDADMAIDPRAIPLLVNGLRATDLVIGSRALADSMVESTYAVRSVMGQLFNRLVTTGTGLGLRDTQCGFKAFRTPAARLLFHLVQINRFAFDVELLARAKQLGLSVAEVPVQWKHVAGSTVHPLHDSVTMLSDIGRSRLGLIPIPPVPSVTVGPLHTSSGSTGEAAPGTHSAADEGPDTLVREVGRVIKEASNGHPFPIISVGEGAIVLLPLIDPDESGGILAAVREAYPERPVTTRYLTLDALAALGPLAGRLDEAPLSGDQE